MKDKGRTWRTYAEAMNGVQQRDDDDAAEGDLFFTPQELARDLIDLVPIETGQTLLDPAKGAGAFFDNFPDNHWRDWNEISQGNDFFNEQRNFDWLITNPPFSQLKKWLVQSAQVATQGFAYIIPLHGLTTHRVKTLADLGWNITSLVLFKNPDTWNIGFQMAWVIWEKKPAQQVRLLNHPKTLQTRLNEY